MHSGAFQVCARRRQSAPGASRRRRRRAGTVEIIFVHRVAAMCADVGYGERGVREGSVSRPHPYAWAPRRFEDYAHGGAFPEINVVQFPEGAGWNARDGLEGPASVLMEYKELLALAARGAFAEARTTPEYEGFLKHVTRCVRDRDGNREFCTDIERIIRVGALKGASIVRRVRDFDASLVESTCLVGEGEPCVFEDGMKDCPGKYWTFDTLKHELGSFTVTCNDRAPARRMDASDGSGVQRTHATSLKDFIEYIESRDGEVTSVREDEEDVLGQAWSMKCVPFYANGMRVFSDPEFAEKLARAFPPPYFTSQCDHTKMLIQMTLDTGLRALARGKDDIPQLFNVDHSVSTSLNKMFCGPKGTITRLHFDCGDAHAWLGQVVGTKLFIFYPPSDSDKLYLIESTHSPIDPLNPDYEKYPLFRQAQARVVILRPGEVVLNPRRWWHYAVALTPSVTVMRNFYNSSSNPHELVSMIIGMVQKVAKGEAVASEPRTQPRGG